MSCLMTNYNEDQGQVMHHNNEERRQNDIRVPKISRVQT